MSFKMMSVMGEALNFGGRRLEVIAHVAWLPVVLLLVVDMTTIFSYLSVSVGKVITFADVPTLMHAKAYAAQYLQQGLVKAPEKMALIAIISLGLNLILISSFMAPLIRYAGLGERPRPGLFRMPFGADQLRYIIASIGSVFLAFLVVMIPIGATSYFVAQYIIEAMSQTMASFPDPDSLHTIKIVTAREGVIAEGGAWYYDYGLPLIAAAPFALLIWIIGMLHFHPANRPHAGEGGNLFLRAIVVLVLAGLLGAGAYWALHGMAINSMGANNIEAEKAIAATPAHANLIFLVIAGMLLFYLNLRLFAYPGVAVCRKSLALGPTLAVTRGWSLFRIPLIVGSLFVLLMLMLGMLNAFIMPSLLSVLNLLYQATETSTRLLHSGEKGAWVLTLFVWIWNFAKIGVNVLWTFFTYGVLAGLYGRLYREAEAAK